MRLGALSSQKKRNRPVSFRAGQHCLTAQGVGLSRAILAGLGAWLPLGRVQVPHSAPPSRVSYQPVSPAWRATEQLLDAVKSAQDEAVGTRGHTPELRDRLSTSFTQSRRRPEIGDSHLTAPAAPLTTPQQGPLLPTQKQPGAPNPLRTPGRAVLGVHGAHTVSTSSRSNEQDELLSVEGSQSRPSRQCGSALQAWRPFLCAHKPGGPFLPVTLVTPSQLLGQSPAHQARLHFSSLGFFLMGHSWARSVPGQILRLFTVNAGSHGCQTYRVGFYWESEASDQSTTNQQTAEEQTCSGPHPGAPAPGLPCCPWATCGHATAERVRAPCHRVSVASCTQPRTLTLGPLCPAHHRAVGSAAFRAG